MNLEEKRCSAQQDPRHVSLEVKYAQFHSPNMFPRFIGLNRTRSRFVARGSFEALDMARPRNSAGTIVAEQRVLCSSSKNVSGNVAETFVSLEHYEERMENLCRLNA